MVVNAPPMHLARFRTEFPEHGVRVVAVGDAVDTAHEDIFLPMRNYINELYARDTSGKIRAALQTKMKDGRPRHFI